MAITDEMKTLVDRDSVKWMETPENGQDGILISSRVRLARNLKDLPFPHRFSTGTWGADCVKVLEDARRNYMEQLPDFLWQDVSAFTEEEKQLLLEKRLLTPEFIEKGRLWQRLLVKKDGELSVLFNEEDHVRIQCVLPGLALEECFQKASAVDDILEQQLDYAFDEKFGYLTAAPTDSGTGMRASVLLHLPAIRLSGQMQQVMQNMSRVGINMRGMYGEGDKAFGNFYQISNQAATGQSEKEICAYLATVAGELVEQEKQLREDLMKKTPYQITDRVKRAEGLLRYAYMLDAAEALSLLSDFRLGIDLGLVQKIPLAVLNRLTLLSHTAHLQHKAGRIPESALEKDRLRAQLMQMVLYGKMEEEA